MARVLVSDALSEQGLEVLRSTPGLEVDNRPGLSEAELAAAIPGVDALVIRSGSKVTAKVIDAATTLKVIGRAGIGVDNVDVPAASKRGIIVMNTPTGNAVTTAEHALGLLMALARRVPAADQSMKAGKWEKKKFEGRELAGKTLAVVGLGNIGRIVADRAKGLRMNVIGFDPVMSVERARELGIELCSLEEVWTRADAITVHTPLTAETRGLVDDKVVAKLKKGVLLVNAARGGIYDEAAILRGLESGHIGGAAFDVFAEEPPKAETTLALIKHERVVATPHLGASTHEAQDRVALEIAQQVAAYLQQGVIQNAVNVPSVSGEVAAKLGPWTELATRLGRFVAQVDPVTPRSITVECVGEPAALSVKAIAASAVAGFLERYLASPVNHVSAVPLAKDRGIEVREQRSETGGTRYASRVSVRIEGEDGVLHTVEGFVGSDGTARLVKWGEFDIEARLGGHALVVRSFDRPGVIGFLGTVLGRANVNVARVHLGMARPGSALSLWNLDGAIPDTALAEIRTSADISGAVAITI